MQPTNPTRQRTPARNRMRTRVAAAFRRMARGVNMKTA